MATNKLMEAAADILSGSKSKAPGMSTQGQRVQLGLMLVDQHQRTINPMTTLLNSIRLKQQKVLLHLLQNHLMHHQIHRIMLVKTPCVKKMKLKKKKKF